MNYARELESPVVVSGEEHTDELSLLRMPPHSFGWDIMPRLLSAGLWRSVSLDIVNPTRIDAGATTPRSPPVERRGGAEDSSAAIASPRTRPCCRAYPPARSGRMRRTASVDTDAPARFVSGNTGA